MGLMLGVKLKLDDLLDGGGVTTDNLAAVDKNGRGAVDAELLAEGDVRGDGILRSRIREARAEGITLEARGYSSVHEFVVGVLRGNQILLFKDF